MPCASRSSPAPPPRRRRRTARSAAAAATPRRRSAADVAALVADHPCYSEEAHHHFARMHVAVAPACNMQCHYCNRKYDCANESRPGVVSERLRPRTRSARCSPSRPRSRSCRWSGIAGPGDALANPEATFATLEGVRRAAPDLRLCLSTNGLALPEHVERLVGRGAGTSR